MAIAMLQGTLAVPSGTSRAFSSLRNLSGSDQLRFQTLLLNSPSRAPRNLTIRMGGGPRTFPGGVSKWQWKRMQAKKAKQLLKARLCRERQLYEMRKRAELKAAVAELEKPWEVVERAPTLFSVNADEQVKALADRFQKPGGFDMWTEKDGPQVFRAPDGLPSARFFPKGVVHSVRPYGIVGGEEADGVEEMRFDDWIARGGGGGSRRSLRRASDRHARGGSRFIDVGVEDSSEQNAGELHTRCLMNVHQDESRAMYVKNRHEDGQELGSDDWKGNRREVRRSSYRQRRGGDAAEAEFVVAEFEDSVRGSEEDDDEKSGSSRFSRDSAYGGRKLAARFGRGGAISSRYPRGSIEEGKEGKEGDAMGRRRHDGGPRSGRGRMSERRSYASDSETMGIDRVEKDNGMVMDELDGSYGRGNARGPYGRGRRLDRRSYALDSETMGTGRVENDNGMVKTAGGRHGLQKDQLGGSYGRRQVTSAPYGRGQRSEQSYANGRVGKDHNMVRRGNHRRSSYVSDSETMATGRMVRSGRNERPPGKHRVSLRPSRESPIEQGDYRMRSSGEF
ncbi:hypothetical protein J5N97_020875 [Dioscorea zingiberensis]|uniref:DEAD-box ATP-dependent RNA helicase 33 n=1 Tax=Dioscorea zingiberensis TaxID=325984 RepID=A0A9D5HDN1_9LILI|nr:hypothetical protein J5N97_020875 [Dioscorea zingiberensis]